MKSEVDDMAFQFVNDEEGQRFPSAPCSQECLLRIARVEQGVAQGGDQLLVLDDAVLVA